MTQRPVLITTRHRGVFFGYLNGEADSAPTELTLTNARNCLYWSSDMHGFIGLATIGPSKHCRVGPAVSKLTLYDVTSVVEVEPTAVERWEAEPWS